MAHSSPAVTAQVVWDLLQTAEKPEEALMELIKHQPHLLHLAAQAAFATPAGRLQWAEALSMARPWVRMGTSNRYERWGFPSYHTEALVEFRGSPSSDEARDLTLQFHWTGFGRLGHIHAGLTHLISNVSQLEALQTVDLFLQDRRHLFLIDGVYQEGMLIDAITPWREE